MYQPKRVLPFCVLAFLSMPAFATITIGTFKPSPAPPEPIGKTITFTATATDSNTGPLAFQFSITSPNAPLTMVKDFLPGKLSAGAWTSPSFTWVPTGVEGVYKIQLVAKDFGSGESAIRTFSFQVTAVASGDTPVIERTANPLVALFSTGACTGGSYMRVAYEQQSGGTTSVTNWVGCHPPATMTFEVAGMYPSTAYNMYAQTKTGNKITNGPTGAFTTGALPTSVPFPTLTGNPAGSDTTYPVVLHNFITFATGGTPTVYPDVATDLSGNIIWYYYSKDSTHSDVLTRPLAGGGNLTLQDDLAWDPTITQEQYLRQIDLAGNVVRETNMGAIQKELVALGAVDGGSCTGLTNPVVGTACAGSLHHDAIQSLPNGYVAALLDIERIYPAGTQGDTTGKPVDIIGDMIIVLNSQWQVVWYWDAFNPSHGGQGYSQLPVSQTAPLKETCGKSTSGCPPMFLLGSSAIAPLAHDWLHANTLYYWPAPQDGNTTGGDIIWSSRHQDRIYRVDYKDGLGTGDILWQMGPPDDGQLQPSSFSMNNTFNDPWPWFSHQHDAGMENSGAGPMTIFDNGDTRIANAPLGLGANCHPTSGPNDCDSRGIALTVDVTHMQVTPVVSFDLGGYSTAMGSAQMLDNGNYFFVNPIVLVLSKGSTFAYSQEISPTPPAPQVGPADFLMNLSGPQQYRGWQLQSLYNPPTT